MKRAMAVMLVAVACGPPERLDDHDDVGQPRHEQLCDEYAIARADLWQLATDPMCVDPIGASQPGREWAVHVKDHCDLSECAQKDLDRVVEMNDCLRSLIACDDTPLSSAGLEQLASKCLSAGPERRSPPAGCGFSRTLTREISQP